MPVRLCLGSALTGARCNERVTDGSRCPEHQREADRLKSDPRRLYRWQVARANVKRRDRYRCIVCGRAHDLSVHHRNGDPADHRLINLVTLCRRHHADAETGRLRL